ncbi:hypothetical protein [Tissierella praeacuta]|uniref:hypothetical protein n=1 Tax=Tissierella praeacuta TaxID=43131 RepID=UPI00334112A6
MTIVRRKRLANGTFGPFEKITDGETPEEKIERLEKEKQALESQVLEVQDYILQQEYEKLLNQGGM